MRVSIIIDVFILMIVISTSLITVNHKNKKKTGMYILI